MTGASAPAADLWWPVVQRARWFQGKSRGGRCADLTALPWLVDTPGLRVRPELLEVAYGDGGTELYQLLAAYRPAGGAIGSVGTVVTDGVRHDVTDAVGDPEAMAAVVAAVARDATYGDTLAARLVRPLPDGDRTPRLFTGEQSNTTVVVGDTALLKVFRRLEPGPNLDRVLTARLAAAGVAHVPAPYGWVEAHRVGAEPLDLMLLSELLHDPEDGWLLATAACRTGTSFAPEAEALGEALGHVHAALAGAPRTLRGDEVPDAMAARLDEAVAAAPVLAAHRAGLAARFEALRGRDLAAQAVHGDFHLGQTLRTASRWHIIDFEGEPLKPMAQRRLPDSPWRDVAGMTRSLAYATSAADDPVGTAASRWLKTAREAFLRAYGETAGCIVDESVLAAYEADKVAYEVVYETRNRPDWVAIPLAAVAALTDPGRTVRP